MITEYYKVILDFFNKKNLRLFIYNFSYSTISSVRFPSFYILFHLIFSNDKMKLFKKTLYESITMFIILFLFTFLLLNIIILMNDNYNFDIDTDTFTNIKLFFNTIIIFSYFIFKKNYDIRYPMLVAYVLDFLYSFKFFGYDDYFSEKIMYSI